MKRVSSFFGSEKAKFMIIIVLLARERERNGQTVILQHGVLCAHGFGGIGYMVAVTAAGALSLAK